MKQLFTFFFALSIVLLGTFSNPMVSHADGVCGPGVALNGGAGSDTLLGSPYNDLIRGLAGNDILRGMACDDTLYGGPGNDKIDGGSGYDTCIGGGGADLFLNCEVILP